VKHKISSLFIPKWIDWGDKGKTDRAFGRGRHGNETEGDR